MTVALDLDGTLITSFPPRRAPCLPPGLRAQVVGKGSSLNPEGVLVVERPGLRDFLHELASFAEVIIFTAGRKSACTGHRLFTVYGGHGIGTLDWSASKHASACRLVCTQPWQQSACISRVLDSIGPGTWVYLTWLLELASLLLDSGASKSLLGRAWACTKLAG